MAACCGFFSLACFLLPTILSFCHYSCGTAFLLQRCNTTSPLSPSYKALLLLHTGTQQALDESPCLSAHVRMPRVLEKLPLTPSPSTPSQLEPCSPAKPWEAFELSPSLYWVWAEMVWVNMKKVVPKKGGVRPNSRPKSDHFCSWGWY